MSNYEYNDNIAEDMIDLLPAHFKKGENNTTIAFFNAIAKQLQYIEDLWEDLRQKLNIQNAENYLLDVVGSWVNLTRNGRTDNEFRALILAEIIQNTTGGQREDVIDLLRLVGGEGVNIWNLAPGWIQATYSADSPILNEHQIAEILKCALSPGSILLSSYAGDEAFAFAGVAPGYGKGFSEGKLGAHGDASCGGIGV